MFSPRVFYVTGQLEKGGAEQQLYYLLKYLRPEGTVLSLSHAGYWADPIRRLGYDVVEFERRQGISRIARVWMAAKLITDQQPDIVHVFMDGISGLNGRLAALLARHSCVVIGERRHPSLDPTWYSLAKRFCLNRSVAAIVANARSSKDYLIAHDRLLPEKALFIPNGLELDRFTHNRPVDHRAMLPESWRDKLIVGMVCSLRPKKSPETYVRVARRVLGRYPNARFLHVGDGPLRPKLEALARAEGIGDSLIFFGLRHNVPEWLRTMDVFVLTSRNEGMSNAVMEAMAVGLPCVLTDTGDCRELVRDGETGFVVPPGDEEKLADRIGVLLQNEDMRLEMGRRAQERVRQFDVRRMADLYKQLYQQVLNRV